MDSIEQQFVQSVLEIDSNRFFNLVEKYGYPKSLLEHIPIDIFDYAFRQRGIDNFDKGLMFPLHYIAACWNDILFLDYDEDSASNETDDRWEKNDKICKYFYWEHSVGGDIPFSDLWMIFNAASPNDGVEECVRDTEQNLLAKGIKKEDIDLYCAVSKFHFDDVKSLLKSGADPTMNFGSKVSTCMQMVEEKRNYYMKLVKPMALHKTYNDGIRMNICNIVGLAAYNKMYRILDYEIQNRAYLKEAIKESNYPSPYLNYAEESRFLYIYVTKTFGWGVGQTFDAVILYDSRTGIAKYAGWSEKNISWDMLIEFPELKEKWKTPEFIEKGKKFLIKRNVINNMFNCNPQIDSYIYDTNNYYIFMKSGERRRYLTIQGGQERLYKPFRWLLRIIDYKY